MGDTNRKLASADWGICYLTCGLHWFQQHQSHHHRHAAGMTWIVVVASVRFLLIVAAVGCQKCRFGAAVKPAVGLTLSPLALTEWLLPFHSDAVIFCMIFLLEFFFIFFEISHSFFICTRARSCFSFSSTFLLFYQLIFFFLIWCTKRFHFFSFLSVGFSTSTRNFFFQLFVFLISRWIFFFFWELLSDFFLYKVAKLVCWSAADTSVNTHPPRLFLTIYFSL